jgi:tRNA A64-2'-O-ribosylphosphate transferase
MGKGLQTFLLWIIRSSCFQGLTPEIFWKYKTIIMESSEDAIPSLVEEWKRESTTDDTGSTKPVLIRPTSTLFIAPISYQHSNTDLEYEQTIVCAPKDTDIFIPKNSLHLICRLGKLGSKDLRSELQKLNSFLSLRKNPPGKKLVLCPTGKDLAVGVALALLCLCYDKNGDSCVHEPATRQDLTKSYIRQRLGWIMASFPNAAPSRATLQAVNVFFMERRG